MGPRAGADRGRRPVVIGAVKTVVALAAPILARIGGDRLPAWTTGRGARALGWIAAVTLTAYGATLTIVGLLVQAGVVEASADAGARALAWHTYLWDPWFAVWGLAFVIALRLSRPDRRDGRARQAEIVS
jgi:hypothetical protein